ncbi:hypothetical protein FHS29_004593 [Saccharothrix tamanrassetensis]|uniref:DUF6292 domain-containing protein n=1 Tax=Saccharothrix tamanrassetensis TaxID=1051531 RepID=A0A841CPR2_9PSEU|nr:DUF6292 family protein [Saccharothrix tamanrassetensis]MBB5957985.1 hypothetical protein [Saccharothrix tamanrassetensis]
MELDFDDALARGLRGYVRLVTEELGLTGECSYVQAERPAGAYLALEGRLREFPGRDVALLWDEERGWSVAVETSSGEDLIVQAHLGADVVPAPRAVARWVGKLFRGGLRGERNATSSQGAPREAHDDLAGRLAPYAAAALVPATHNA